jgi:hypothetical protein
MSQQALRLFEARVSVHNECRTASLAEDIGVLRLNRACRAALERLRRALVLHQRLRLGRLPLLRGLLLLMTLVQLLLLLLLLLLLGRLILAILLRLLWLCFVVVS